MKRLAFSILGVVVMTTAARADYSYTVSADDNVKAGMSCSFSRAASPVR
jgi:hypothetical protein